MAENSGIEDLPTAGTSPAAEDHHSRLIQQVLERVPDHETVAACALHDSSTPSFQEFGRSLLAVEPENQPGERSQVRRPAEVRVIQEANSRRHVCRRVPGSIGFASRLSTPS